MYNTVYIKDANDGNFSKLMMNCLVDCGIRFNNIDTTYEEIKYKNVFVYIPKEGIANLPDNELIKELNRVQSLIYKFKRKYIIVSNKEDYNTLLMYINNINCRHNTNFYQGLDFSTLYAKIVSEDIASFITTNRKSYNNYKRSFSRS